MAEFKSDGMKNCDGWPEWESETGCLRWTPGDFCRFAGGAPVEHLWGAPVQECAGWVDSGVCE